MQKMLQYAMVSVHLYDDGEAVLTLNVMDMATRRLVPTVLGRMQLDAKIPQTLEELLFIAAGECVGRRLYADDEVLF